MTAALTDQTYFIGQGVVSFAPRISGGVINGGYTQFGDVQMLSIDQSKQKIVEVEENLTGFGGTALYASVAIPIALKLQLTQWSMENLALACYGSNSGPGIGGSVTAEATTAYNGQTMYLANIGISALVLKTTGGTPVTLVEGTDYTYNAQFGAYTILPGSTVVPAGPGTALTAAYTWAANNGSVGSLLTQPPEIAIMYQGLNVANPAGQTFGAVKVFLNRVRLNLSKSLDMLSKKEGILELDGAILFDQTVPAGVSQYYTITKA